MPWFFVILLAVVLWLVKGRYKRLLLQIKAKGDAGNAIAEIVPGGSLLRDFVNNCLFDSGYFAKMRHSTHNIQAYLVEKSFSLHGEDCNMTLKFKMRNIGIEPISKFVIYSFGGSAVRAEQLRQIAKQFVEGSEIPLKIHNKQSTDRLFEISLIMSRPVAPNEDFEVLYEEFWPGAMVYGYDAVFYTEALYFKEPVQKVVSQMSFDIDPDNICAYSLDLKKRKCMVAAFKVKRIHNSKDGHHFRLVIEYPRPNMLYFTVFHRTDPRQRATYL